MHTSHPSAFISSTFIDLKDERSAVAEILQYNGLNVNALDIKPASTESSKKEIIRGIKESDFVILLIGDRYGSVLPFMTGNRFKSITWWEYERAIISGKPIIAYFKENINNNESDHDDKNDNLYNKKRQLFIKFKNIITNKHNPAYFSDVFDLSEKIQKSLIPTYRSGVEKLTRKNIELNEKILNLENELESVKRSTQKNKAIQTSPNALTTRFLKGLDEFK